MILENRTRNDLYFWFAHEHGKHPNLVDALLTTADYGEDAVEVVAKLSGVKYKIVCEELPYSEGILVQATYRVESVP